MTSADSVYHRLFSHPLMVAELVRGFVPDALAAGLDFDQMHRVPAKFHATTGPRREGDVIWRLPTHGSADIYLYLMIEFQSKSDWWMAVRTLVYQGLLWQQLIAEKALVAGECLPPIMMIVLFNGDPRWSAPVDLARVIALPDDSPLWPWQPQARYHLIDMGAVSDDQLMGRESAAALLFRLDRRHEEPEDLAALIGDVITWFRRHPGHEQLRQVFTELATHAMSVTAPNLIVPGELIEMQTVLSTQGQAWRDKWLAQGEAKGEAKGKAEGEAKGKAEGLREGQALALISLLERRFGPLAAGVRDRVSGADLAATGLWLDRVLDAPSLDAVFDDTGP